MDQDATTSVLEEMVTKDTWTVDDHRQILEQLFGAQHAVNKFRSALADLEARDPQPTGAAALKIGIARYMLCRFQSALNVLSEATDNKDRHFIAGQCYRALRQWGPAVEEFQRAKARGWDDDRCDILIVTCLAMSGQLDEARRQADPLCKKLGDTPDALFLQGLLAELDGQTEEAIDLYESARAKQHEPHPEATFRQAYLLDLYGNEEEAIDLYEDCETQPPVYANALLNRAVLLEDNGEYEEALICLKRLLKANPDHARARLFLRDVEASTDMYYDEDQARRIAKRNAVLDIPVTDFELSVRARNCLKKMDIHTLGDLVRTSEAELLGYKNFGETSLKEIKDMLAAKGLRLGQALEEAELGEEASLDADTPEEPPAEEIIPIEQVELSVRARRVLEQLGIQSLGELAKHSETELMGQKNFGQTSLNELRQRLHEYGMDFRE